MNGLAQSGAEEAEQQATPWVEQARRWAVEKQPDDLPERAANLVDKREALRLKGLGHSANLSPRNQDASSIEVTALKKTMSTRFFKLCVRAPMVPACPGMHDELESDAGESQPKSEESRLSRRRNRGSLRINAYPQLSHADSAHSRHTST